MHSHKFLSLALFCLFLAGIQPCFAQEKENAVKKVRRKHSFVVHLGGGISRYSAAINTRSIGLPGSIIRNSGAATFRFMWYPDHRLKLGFETGYMNFYSYDVKNGNISGKLNLRAIPLLMIWSMPIINRVNIYAGFGSYILTTHLSYNGVVNSRAVVLGSNIALSYTQPITPRLGIAAEAKWMNAFESRDAALSLQVQVVWKFLQWL